MIRFQRRTFLSHVKLGEGNGGHPVVICHGLLGNKNNFYTVGKLLSKRTNRTVFSLGKN
jgi:hypothetical protein